MTKRKLYCAICAGNAGQWQQHWNRDTGFGVCVSCVEWLRQRGHKMPVATETEIADLYGKEGVNWGKSEYEPPRDNNVIPGVDY